MLICVLCTFFILNSASPGIDQVVIELCPKAECHASPGLRALSSYHSSIKYLLQCASGSQGLWCASSRVQILISHVRLKHIAPDCCVTKV